MTPGFPRCCDRSPRRGIEEIDAIADALRHFRAGPPLVVSRATDRCERVLVSLRLEHRRQHVVEESLFHWLENLLLDSAAGARRESFKVP